MFDDIDEITKHEGVVYNIIHKIRMNMKNYTLTNNRELLTETVEIYQNDLLPALENLRESKYKNNSIEYNDIHDTWHLNQIPDILQKIPHSVEEPKVIHNNK